MNKKESFLESLKQQGFSKKIVEAFSEVHREDFIPEEMKEYSYDDTSLPIGKGQTISQPYVIGLMLSLLELDKIKYKKERKILEIGSGSGYVLTLISEIIGKNNFVFGIELIKELFEKSKRNITKVNDYNNIKVYHKNGFYGLPDKAPFDKIIISASCMKIPEKLINQLKEKGIIVAPVGGRYEQSLISYKKINGKLEKIKEIPGFLFVPFIEESEEH